MLKSIFKAWKKRYKKTKQRINKIIKAITFNENV